MGCTGVLPYAMAGCLLLDFSRTMSSVAKSASFLKVPWPKSFLYESVKPSIKLNSGVQSRSAIAYITNTA